MIGIFDSGLGGLTVVKELMRQMSGRDFVYFGDTARTPYGSKGADAIRRFGVEDARFLVSRGAKVIIVACNTVSAVAIDDVRAAVDVPVFDVVTPAVEAAAHVTAGRVGVIGTRGTVASGVYERKMRDVSPATEVLTQACPLFVPLVEEGWHDRPEAESIANAYLAPLRLWQIDTLILGCTHYPFLERAIRKAIGAHVTIVDPAGETVSRFAAYLAAHPDLDAALPSGGTSAFYVSDKTDRFADIASRWLGTEVVLESATAEAHT